MTWVVIADECQGSGETLEDALASLQAELDAHTANLANAKQRSSNLAAQLRGKLETFK